MSVIATLITTLGLDSSTFTTGLDEATKRLRGTQKKFAATGAELQKIGAVMTVGITAPFIAATNAAMEGALAQRQAMAQVTSALESMGPVAGRTADQLSKAADALEAKSLVDADVILTKVTANLLTFGNVAGTVFDRAQQAAIDMAQRLGQDPQAAAIMLGKALNDPVKGLTALTRVGVSFSASQIETVKQLAATGQTAKAQGLILTEVERQFKGAAQAAAETDPYRQMNVALGQVSDVLGEAALNVLPSFTSGIKLVADAFLALPSSTQTSVIALVAVSAALGPVIAAIGTLVTGIGAALPVLAALRVALMTQAVPALVTFATTMAPLLLPLAAVAGAIALVIAAIRHWDEIKAITARVVGYMRDLYTGVKSWIGDKLNAVWDGVKKRIDDTKQWFFGLYDAVVGHSYIPDMVDEIGEHMARLDQTLVAPTRAATQSAAEAFQALGQKVQPILDRLFPGQAKVNQFQRDMADLVEYAKKAGWTAEQLEEAQQRLRNEAGGLDPATRGGGIIAEPTFGTTITPENTADTVEDAWERVRKANAQTVESFAGLARDVIGSLGQFGRSLKSGDWAGALQSVLDTISQISGIIKGTGQPATRTYPVDLSLSGARAAGGPVLPNRNYLVGERGPEILRMGGRSGSIVPNDQIGGAGVVHIAIEEGALFRPVVRSEAGAVSVQTVSSNNRMGALRGRQALGS
jgi:hypothetical protein